MTFRPFQDVQVSLGNLQDEMNQMFERIWHGGVSTRPFDGQEWAPSIDLFEQEDRYELFVEVAGVDANSIDCSYIDKTLTVRGTKSLPEEAADAGKPVRTERRFGDFCRAIELPEDIEADRLVAKCRDGVLRIVIPKTESNKPRPIKIDISQD